MKQHTGLVYMGAGIYFVVALALGVSLLFNAKRPGNQSTPACSTCILADVQESDPWQSSR